MSPAPSARSKAATQARAAEYDSARGLVAHDSYEIHDESYKPGDRVEIVGAAGSFKVRKFYTQNGGDMLVEVFGGTDGRASIRTFTADRIAPPEGSKAHAEARGRELAPDAIRAAIAEHGRVEVPLQNADDPVERKKTSNLVFNRAYSLGLKGRFRVRVVDGVVIGERTE